jgi:hypothetical protein
VFTFVLVFTLFTLITMVALFNIVTVFMFTLVTMDTLAFKINELICVETDGRTDSQTWPVFYAFLCTSYKECIIISSETSINNNNDNKNE